VDTPSAVMDRFHIIDIYKILNGQILSFIPGLDVTLFLPVFFIAIFIGCGETVKRDFNLKRVEQSTVFASMTGSVSLHNRYTNFLNRYLYL
jgi:hypothetical protein